MALTLLGAGEATGRENESENAAVTALTKLGVKIQRNSEARGKPVVAVDLSQKNGPQLVLRALLSTKRTASPFSFPSSGRRSMSNIVDCMLEPIYSQEWISSGSTSDSFRNRPGFDLPYPKWS
jgi:hypothetical protein